MVVIRDISYLEERKRYCTSGLQWWLCLKYHSKAECITELWNPLKQQTHKVLFNHHKMILLLESLICVYTQTGGDWRPALGSQFSLSTFVWVLGFELRFQATRQVLLPTEPSCPPKIMVLDSYLCWVLSTFLWKSLHSAKPLMSSNLWVSSWKGTLADHRASVRQCLLPFVGCHFHCDIISAILVCLTSNR